LRKDHLKVSQYVTRIRCDIDMAKPSLNCVRFGNFFQKISSQHRFVVLKKCFCIIWGPILHSRIKYYVRQEGVSNSKCLEGCMRLKARSVFEKIDQLAQISFKISIFSWCFAGRIGPSRGPRVWDRRCRTNETGHNIDV